MINIRHRYTYVDETQINVDAVKHGCEGSDKDPKAAYGIMPYAKDLSVGGLGIDV